MQGRDHDVDLATLGLGQKVGTLAELKVLSAMGIHCPPAWELEGQKQRQEVGSQ